MIAFDRLQRRSSTIASTIRSAPPKLRAAGSGVRGKLADSVPTSVQYRAATACRYTASKSETLAIGMMGLAERLQRRADARTAATAATSSS